MKVVDAIGAQLDWMVAKCEGDEFVAAPGVNGIGMEYEATRYSTNWAQGGAIVEREGISIYRMTSDWSAAYNPSGAAQDGPTPLIAAMRCLVAAKLSDEVEVPDELL